MVEPVKRRYNQSARAATSEQTRLVIVEAAVALFELNGFGITTVDEIAERAGVSRRTVFTSVGGKLGALKLALDWAVTGDAQEIPLQDRAVIKRMGEEPDPGQLMIIWVDLTTGMSQRLAPLSRVLSAAAERDPDIRELRRHRQQARLAGQRAFARRLDQLNALGPQLTAVKAADELWLFSDPVLYDRLVHDRGWSQARFRAWLTRATTTSILRQQYW